MTMEVDASALNDKGSHVQRLWALTRGVAPESCVGLDSRLFVHAIAILATGGNVGVGFIRTGDPRRTTDDCLVSARVRQDMTRTRAVFATLESAMAWADQQKRAWLSRGWTELAGDLDDC
jgi:hypothetical protein